MRKLILLLATVMLLGVYARADALPAPFTGYSDKAVFLRPAPAASSDYLASIPPETPFELEPVSDTFARVTWQGRTGYVYYPTVRRMPKETPVEPHLVYLPENKYLFALPLDGADPLLTVQAETPVTALAETDRFLRIEAQGKTGYVYIRDTKAVDDMEMEPTNAEFYVESAAKTRALPLRNAPAGPALEPGRIYLAEALCNGHYRVTIGDQTGYIPLKGVKTLQQQGKTLRAAIIAPETALFTAPKQNAGTVHRMPETVLMLLDPQENGFQRLHGTKWYVRANDVAAYAVTAQQDLRLHLKADAALLLKPETGAPETAQAAEGSLFSEVYGTEDWYLLAHQDRWGFLRRDDPAIAVLRTDARMMPTAAVTLREADFYTASGRQDVLTPDNRLLLTESAGDFYRCRAGLREGYILKEHVEILGSDTELTPYTVAAPAEITALDFPDAHLSKAAFVIPRGEKLQVTGFNRCYLIVKYAGQTGYAQQTGLLTAESEGIPRTEEIPGYTLLLNKADGMAYVFLLTEEGERGELIICAKVAIGKRTTPTPTGTYLLGRKERWHAFTLSYTPHTTEYVKARFIHGWPCERKNEATVKKGLIQTGMVTGGCLRSPFEFARWVYMNCTSYVTQLEIVNGGFEPPANAADMQVQ